MPRYQDADASFDTPLSWVDRTIVAFAASTEKKGDASPNFVMTKEAIREGDSLRGHVDRQLIELGRHLKDFDLLESRETSLAGLPALYMRYTWMGHFGLLEQSITVVERIIESKRLATTFTTTVPAAEAEGVKATFEEMLKSVHFAAAPTNIPPVGGPAGQPPPRDTDVPYVPMPGRPRR